MIYIIGHSHSLSYIDLSMTMDGVEAWRFYHEKRAQQVRSIEFRDFLSIASEAPKGSLVVSASFGSHYSEMSSLEATPPYRLRPEEGCQLIPMRVMQSAFAHIAKNSEILILRQMQKSLDHRIVHLLAPPPKADNAILQAQIDARHKRRFTIAPAPLRLQVYRLYRNVLAERCRRLGVTLLEPPPAALDAKGFLRPEYAAPDLAHANNRYAQLQLERLIEMRG